MRKRIDECIDHAMLALWLSLKDELYFPYGFYDAEELREWMDRNMAGQTMVVSLNGVEIVHDMKGHRQYHAFGDMGSTHSQEFFSTRAVIDIKTII